MSFTTPLLGYNRGPGAQYGGIGGAFFGSLDPWSTPLLSPWHYGVSTPTLAYGITTGEVVGYKDFEPIPLPVVPVGEAQTGPVTVGLLPPGSVFGTGAGVPTVDAGEPVFEEGSIFAPGEVWGDDLPPGTYDVPYEDIEYPYPELPGTDPLEPEGDTQVAVTWTDFLTGTTQGLIDALIPGSSLGPVGVAPQQFAAGTGATAPPAKVTVDTKTGKVTPCHRRRRRRLLTEGDFNDLMRIATLPNKQNVAVALSKAVGRR